MEPEIYKELGHTGASATQQRSVRVVDSSGEPFQIVTTETIGKRFLSPSILQLVLGSKTKASIKRLVVLFLMLYLGSISSIFAWIGVLPESASYLSVFIFPGIILAACSWNHTLAWLLLKNFQVMYFSANLTIQTTSMCMMLSSAGKHQMIPSVIVNSLCVFCVFFADALPKNSRLAFTLGKVFETLYYHMIGMYLTIKHCTSQLVCHDMCVCMMISGLQLNKCG